MSDKAEKDRIYKEVVAFYTRMRNDKNFVEETRTLKSHKICKKCNENLHYIDAITLDNIRLICLKCNDNYVSDALGYIHTLEEYEKLRKELIMNEEKQLIKYEERTCTICGETYMVEETRQDSICDRCRSKK